ncbi:MAG TPA: hypothetical protein VEI94_16685 [Candidatus Bathyarchaeia archaeon]|nr:hypothetical protein [Candidatus Bathyarchaeia archaeon]
MLERPLLSRQLRLLAVGLAALAGSSCGDRGGAGAGAVLTVNDPDFQGTVGDSLLSLTEAIELATGALAPGALSAGERARISGRPGAGRPDRIRFAAGLTIAVRAVPESVDSILPPLTDPGDAVEGLDVVIDGSAMGGQPQAGRQEAVFFTDLQNGTAAIASLLVVAASRVSVSGLTFANLPATAIVVVGSAGEGVEGVNIRGNTVRGLGRNTPSGGFSATAGVNASGNTLSDLTIADNQISDAAGITVLTAIAIGAGQTAQQNRMARIHIRGNRIERPITGIIGYAATAQLGASALDNALDDLEISGNQIIENLDVGILTSTTQPLDSGPTARNLVQGVRIADNTLRSPPDFGRLNSGIYASGGQVFSGGTSDGDRFEGLTIERNVVDGYATGLQIYGGIAERCGSGSGTSNSSLSGARIHDNLWQNVTTGVLVVGGAAYEIGGSVQASQLTDVVLERETIAAREAGLVVSGSLANGLPLGAPCLACNREFPGYHLPGEERDNRLGGLVVRDSRIAATNPVVIFGGTMTQTEDTILASAVSDVTLEGNTIDGAPGVIVGGGVVTGSGTVRDCTVDGVRLSGNHDAAGNPLQPIVVDEVATGGAPPASVSGNSVAGVTGD